MNPGLARSGRHPRGAPVVGAVLGAALAELGRVGYAGLRVEEVAARAGVDKTTVYRRWPTKAELLEAALSRAASPPRAPREESGDLRTNLLGVARQLGGTWASAHGRGALRLLLGGCPDSAVAALASSTCKRIQAPARRALVKAARRGDLRPGVDPSLVVGTVTGWVALRMLGSRRTLSGMHLRGLVDLLLLGALRRSCPPPGRARPRRNRARRSGIHRSWA